MLEFFHTNSGFGPFQDPGALVLGFLLYVALGLLPLLGALWLIYFLLTLPMRRNERARLFLDLLELGLKNGCSAEAAIIDASSARDSSLGARFHLVAAYLEKGLTLGDALAEVPFFLPPQVVGILRAGDHLGDQSKVLPACRLLLADSVSSVRGALNYLVVLCFTATPFTILVPLVLKLKVLPAYNAVFSSILDGAQLPALAALIFDLNSTVLVLQTALFALIWLITIGYLGGPRLHRAIDRILPGASDQMVRFLPWRWKRLQRNFSAMLAVLLDEGVPEGEAVEIAGQNTSNLVMERGAARVSAKLRQGVKLPEALRELDRGGELRWRMANALRRGRGFTRALTGWHEALDAKAFQLEQAAAQLATTFVVLFNGLVVAGIVIGIFMALITIINRATLW